MGYREKWFEANKPTWGNKYMCVKCGGYFKKCDIDIDHKIPKKKGGTDDLWNIQPMCKHCNRSKGKNQSGVETIDTVVGAAMNGELNKVVGGVVKQGLKDIIGIKYKR